LAPAISKSLRIKWVSFYEHKWVKKCERPSFGETCSIELGVVSYKGCDLIKFIAGEITATIPAHDESSGLASCCFRSSSIFQGKKVDKSSGALPWFSAHA